MTFHPFWVEVYVQEFPVAHSKWQVSTEGGRDPFWRGDGREMYSRAADLSLMAVPVTTITTFEMGTPKALFKARFPTQLPARGLYRAELELVVVGGGCFVAQGQASRRPYSK